jgi:hypothetical protein
MHGGLGFALAWPIPISGKHCIGQAWPISSSLLVVSKNVGFFVPLCFSKFCALFGF